MTIEDLIDYLIELQNSEDYEEGMPVVGVSDDTGRHYSIMSPPEIKNFESRDSFKQEQKKVLEIS